MNVQACELVLDPQLGICVCSRCGRALPPPCEGKPFLACDGDLAPTEGPGTELESLVATVSAWLPMFNVKDCNLCRTLRDDMNRWGGQGCKQRVDSDILPRLKYNAEFNKIKIPPGGARLMVWRAIRNWEKKQAA